MKRKRSTHFLAKVIAFQETTQEALDSTETEKLGPMSSVDIFEWMVAKGFGPALEEIPVTPTTAGRLLAEMAKRRVFSSTHATRSPEGRSRFTIFRKGGLKPGYNLGATSSSREERLVSLFEIVLRETGSLCLGPVRSDDLYEDLVAKGYEEALLLVPASKWIFGQTLYSCSSNPSWSGVSRSHSDQGGVTYVVKASETRGKVMEGKESWFAMKKSLMSSGSYRDPLFNPVESFTDIVRRWREVRPGEPIQFRNVKSLFQRIEDAGLSHLLFKLARSYRHLSRFIKTHQAKLPGLECRELHNGRLEYRFLPKNQKG